MNSNWQEIVAECYDQNLTVNECIRILKVATGVDFSFEQIANKYHEYLTIEEGKA